MYGADNPNTEVDVLYFATLFSVLSFNMFPVWVSSLTAVFFVDPPEVLQKNLMQCELDILIHTQPTNNTVFNAASQNIGHINT
jgi:hypothetical protein